MGKKLFVGNIPWKVTEDDLSGKFAQCGTVVSAKIITDRETGRSRGFGFVEMSSDEEANKAVLELNNVDIEGRTLRVNEAQEKSRDRR